MIPNPLIRQGSAAVDEAQIDSCLCRQARPLVNNRQLLGNDCKQV